MDFPIDFLTSPSILACVFDGNLLTKTAPKPNQTLAATVTTTYAYDVLHRLIEKSYNDGATATVKYGYDNIWPSGCTPPTMTITNPIGRRTSMCDAGGASAWTYDDRGRVVRERRKMNDVTNTKDVFYEYKHDNALWRITYPNTQFMTYSYDPAGRSVSLIEGTTNWLTDMTYHPHGAPSAYKLGVGLGGFAGYNNSFTYNSRLQPLTIAANIINGATILSRTYDFHLGTDNNGNVYKITNNLDGGTRPIGTVDYTYDQLNRIATAATTGTDCTVTPSGLTKNWGNSYEIDPWGNLNKKNVTKCSAEYLNEQVNEKNQFTGTNRYDAAGNLWENGTYTYDAENRLLTAGGVTYTYDGDGRRVKKSSGTLYWYDVNGNVLVETQADPAGTWLESHRYFGGKRILRHKVNGAVRYIFADHLGSASVVGNFNGAIMEELDFYPYGGTRVISSAESNAYKFTGKERDSESELDYFGARYYGSNTGRFSTTDPGHISDRHPLNPQKWNSYAYVINNPLLLVDPDGREEWEFRITAQIDQHMTYFPVPAKGGVKFQQTFVIETDPSKSATGKLQYKGVVGPSEGVALRPGFGSVRLEWGEGQEGKAGVAEEKQKVYRDRDGNVVIESHAAARYPLFPSPPIDSMFLIIISQDNKVMFTTSHDRFPTHILEYRRAGTTQWQLLYRARPRSWDTPLFLFSIFPNRRSSSNWQKLREKVTVKIKFVGFVE
jgi:RHS repeat-associated protein